MKRWFLFFSFGLVSFFTLHYWQPTLTRSVRAAGPTQVHLSLTTDSSRINVNWASSTASNTSQVKYGVTSGVYSKTSDGNFIAIGNSNLVANYHQYVSTWDVYTSPFLYSATMSNLSSATTYYYIVGDPVANLWSSEFSFQTVPETTVRVVAYGDQGENQNSIGLLNLIKAQDPNLVIHAGDIAYANGNSNIWDQYMTFVEPLASKVPYEGGYGENFVPYTNLFAMPNNKFWYSFNYGPIHIIAFSTEHDYSNTSSQYQFLVSDLKNVNRVETPWIFLFAHKPPYNSNSNYGSFLAVRAALEPLFSKYSVDLGIFGHEHSYERTWPLLPGSVVATTANGTRQDPFISQPNSTIYTVVGTGGEGLRNSWSPTPEWSVYHQASRNGFAFIEVKGGDYLHWQYITDDNLVSDEFYLCKNSPCEFNNTSTSTSTSTSSATSSSSTMGSTSTTGAKEPAVTGGENVATKQEVEFLLLIVILLCL